MVDGGGLEIQTGRFVKFAVFRLIHLITPDSASRSRCVRWRPERPVLTRSLHWVLHMGGADSERLLYLATSPLLHRRSRETQYNSGSTPRSASRSGEDEGMCYCLIEPVHSCAPNTCLLYFFLRS